MTVTDRCHRSQVRRSLEGVQLGVSRTLILLDAAFRTAAADLARLADQGDILIAGKFGLVIIITESSRQEPRATAHANATANATAIAAAMLQPQQRWVTRANMANLPLRCWNPAELVSV